MSISSPLSKSSVRQTIVMAVDNEFYGDSRVENEARILSKNGFTIKIICFTFGNLPVYQNLNGIEVYRIKINRKLKNILFGIANTFPIYNFLWAIILIKYCKRLNANAIHAHDLYMAYPVSMAAKILKLPHVLDLHENYPEAVKGYRWATKFPARLIAQPSRWQRVEKKRLVKASRIIALSEDFAKSLHKKHPSIPKKSIWVYPNVPDAKQLLGFRVEKTSISDEEYFNITYFGGISQRRGIYTSLQALKILIESHKNFRLILIGPVDGHEKSTFESALSKKTIKNHVIHIPWIDISLLPSYINDSRICISPIVKNAQHDSGVANKVFQYMLLRKPVIVSNSISQARIIQEANCGLIFESENAKDLSQKILELYNNENLRNEMGANGQMKVLEKYNTEHFGNVLAHNYRELFADLT